MFCCTELSQPLMCTLQIIIIMFEIYLDTECASPVHVTTSKQKRSRHAPQCGHTSLMLYYGQNIHQVMEYHEHSYLVSLLFAAPFLLFIIFSKIFSTCINSSGQPIIAKDHMHAKLKLFLKLSPLTNVMIMVAR